jgi:hypothetical protein
MDKLKKHDLYKNTGVLLLWKRGEEDSFLRSHLKNRITVL